MTFVNANESLRVRSVHKEGMEPLSVGQRRHIDCSELYEMSQTVIVLWFAS